MTIRDWPENERPREKLLKLGAGALSEAELLAIFLRVGMQGKSAVELARDLLNHFGSLARLFAAPLTEFSAIPGMGPAKYTQLQAVLELARRALHEELRQGETLSSPKAVRDYLRLSLSALPHEVFLILFLDTQNRLIITETLSRGTLNQAQVYPREVVKLALKHNAAAVILAHNHPSGLSEASVADRALTVNLKDALALVEVRVLDHFVVAGSNSPLSFSEQGWL